MVRLEFFGRLPAFKAAAGQAVCGDSRGEQLPLTQVVRQGPFFFCKIVLNCSPSRVVMVTWVVQQEAQPFSQAAGHGVVVRSSREYNRMRAVTFLSIRGLFQTRKQGQLIVFRQAFNAILFFCGHGPAHGHRHFLFSFFAPTERGVFFIRLIVFHSGTWLSFDVTVFPVTVHKIGYRFLISLDIGRVAMPGALGYKQAGLSRFEISKQFSGHGQGKFFVKLPMH